MGALCGEECERSSVCEEKCVREQFVKGIHLYINSMVLHQEGSTSTWQPCSVAPGKFRVPPVLLPSDLCICRIDSIRGSRSS